MKFEDLSDAQLDGFACIGCNSTGGWMQPAGRIRGVQVFAHEACQPDEDVITAACGRALAENGTPDPLPARSVPSFSSVAQGPAADRGAA